VGKVLREGNSYAHLPHDLLLLGFPAPASHLPLAWQHFNPR
jgi:hypothetical protein